MPSNRLVPTLLLALVLAGCGGPSLTAARVASNPGVDAASFESAAALDLPTWIDPAVLSTPDDPAEVEAEPGQPQPPAAKKGEIVNFKQVDAVLYRGGLPSAANLKGLKQLGVKTDITLMGEIPVYDTAMVLREKLWAKQAGLKFVQVKVPTGRLPIGPAISNKVVDEFLKVALDPANQPCFVHCLHGRDRTGTMVATYQISQHNYTNEQALAEMKTFGFSPKSYPKLAAFVQAYKPTVAIK